MTPHQFNCLARAYLRDIDLHNGTGARVASMYANTHYKDAKTTPQDFLIVQPRKTPTTGKDMLARFIALGAKVQPRG